MPRWTQYVNTTEDGTDMPGQWIDITNEFTYVNTAYGFDSNGDPPIIANLIERSTIVPASMYVRVTYTIVVTTGRFITIGSDVAFNFSYSPVVELNFSYSLDGVGTYQGVASLENTENVYFTGLDLKRVSSDGVGIGTITIDKIEVFA